MLIVFTSSPGVMGVGRPAGETLYFGKIAAAVLENSQHSILLVSS